MLRLVNEMFLKVISSNEKCFSKLLRRREMAHRYDSKTTIFSPEGRLYQVEYAMEAISHAGSAMGILCTDGIVLAAEKRIVSKLLDQDESHEKLYKIDHHVGCAVAGITADASTLVNHARISAQRYTYTYSEPMPIEMLVQQVADLKQGYTQFGGLRPHGVSILFAGYDINHGFQLYVSDPSGNYSGWKAFAIGANSQAAQSIFKQEYKENMDVNEGKKLVLAVLKKTLDTTKLSADNLEIAMISLNEKKKCEFKLFTSKDLSKMIKDE